MARLLIGTSKRVLIWPEFGGPRTVLEGHGLYCGCSWDWHNVYVVERNHYGSEECEQERIMIYDPVTFKPLGEIGRPDLRLHDVHDVYYHPDEDVLYITNSGRDEICIWCKHPRDGKHPIGVLPWESLLGLPPEAVRADRFHVNSIWWGKPIWKDTGDSKMYVVQHKRGPSAIAETSQNYDLRKTYSVGHDAHNVVVTGRWLWTLSSRENALICYDRTLDCVDSKIDLPGEHYPRGLAMDRSSIWVGLTRFEKVRGVRNDGPAQIARIGRTSLRVEDLIDLEDVGQVFFIRLMSGTDIAHNGLSFPEAQDE